MEIGEILIANFTIKVQNIPCYFQNGTKIEKYEKSIDNNKIFQKGSYPDLIAFIFNQLYHALYSNQYFTSFCVKDKVSSFLLAQD